MCKVLSLNEFLGLKGLAFPVSDFMVDKVKVPHGLTDRQKKNLERDAAAEAKAYTAARQEAIKEYEVLCLNGDICEPSRLESLLRTAKGHPDNSQTQAAIRLLKKRYGVHIK